MASQPITTQGTVTGEITGTGSTYVNYISPMGNYHRGEHINYIYYKDELDAAGFAGGGAITHLGFNVRTANLYPNQNWTLRLMHTTQTTPPNLGSPYGYGDPGPWTTVHNIASYNTTSTGWDLLTLNNQTFVWDGVQNLKVEVCWGPNAGYTSSSSYGSVWTISSNTTLEGFSYYYTSSTITSGCALTYLYYNYSPDRRAQVQLGMDQTITVYPEPDTFTFKKMDLGSCNIINSECGNTIYVAGDVKMGNGNLVTGLKLYALGQINIGNDNDINGTFIADNFKVGHKNELSVACCWNVFKPVAEPVLVTIDAAVPYSTSYGLGPNADRHPTETLQYIYPAAEIIADGVEGVSTLTHVGFNVQVQNTYPNLNWQLQVQNTSKSSFATSSGSPNYYHDAGPWTTIQTVASYQPAIGWDLRANDVDFEWDGVSNLMFRVCWTASTSSYISTTSGGRVARFTSTDNPLTNNVTYYYMYTTAGTNSCPQMERYRSSSYLPFIQMQFLTGGAKMSEPEEEAATLKTAVASEGIKVYPNPFSNSTTFNFEIAEAGKASLEIYNMAGARVATVFEGEVEANSTHNVVFNASNLPTGVYFYNLTTGTKVYHGKLTIAK